MITCSNCGLRRDHDELGWYFWKPAVDVEPTIQDCEPAPDPALELVTCCDGVPAWPEREIVGFSHACGYYD